MRPANLCHNIYIATSNELNVILFICDLRKYICLTIVLHKTYTKIL